MELIVISVICLMISGIITFTIDDIWLSRTILSYTESMIANGLIFCVIYTILVIIMVLNI